MHMAHPGVLQEGHLSPSLAQASASLLQEVCGGKPASQQKGWMPCRS